MTGHHPITQKKQDQTDRRRFFHRAGAATLSATAIAVLAGRPALAHEENMKSKDHMTADLGILTFAAGKEMEAIAAYQLGAESGLLSAGVLKTAVLFQSQHKEHRDTLISVIEQFGGTPPSPLPMSEYAEKLGAASLKSEEDVLRFALGLEKGAANAYVSAVPKFHSKDLSAASAKIAADEVMHWTAFASALGEPLPKTALSFG